MKQLNILNMSQFQITNAIFHVLSSAPSSPLEGQYYYNSVSKGLEWHNGTRSSARSPAPITPGLSLRRRSATSHATVRANSLDQMTAPAADVAWNSKKITGLLDPTNAQDAATKNYVDIQVQSAAAGIDSKPSVRVVATSNIALTGLQTIDGVTLIAGDRVLAQNNTTTSQNGVYVVASGAWTRQLTQMPPARSPPGAFWFVEEGTTNNKTQWRCNNTGAITLGTTGITIVQFGASPRTPRATVCSLSAATSVLWWWPAAASLPAPAGCRSIAPCAQPFLDQRRRCLGDQHRRHSQPEHSGRGRHGA
jgi:phage-related tail fiber protein